MKGILHIIGAGPGDPELLTIKAFHVLTENTDVVAYITVLAELNLFCKRH